MNVDNRIYGIVLGELIQRSKLNPKVPETAKAVCYEATVRIIDPLLVCALIHVESGGNPGAVSSAGAIGLMQLMPATGLAEAAKLEMAVKLEDLYDPCINVVLGTSYLSGLNKAFSGDWPLALTAYNRGPHNTRRCVEKFGALPQHVLDAYATLVLRYYHKLCAKVPPLNPAPPKPGKP